jgi:hypothetical protein
MQVDEVAADHELSAWLTTRERCNRGEGHQVIALLLLVPLALMVILQAARLVSLRRVANRLDPPAPASHGSAVRVLSTPKDLAAALDRAAATERRVVGIVGGRLARYEQLQGDQKPVRAPARGGRGGR